jgi:ketosteroid isomerase-like protein
MRGALTSTTDEDEVVVYARGSVLWQGKEGGKKERNQRLERYTRLAGCNSTLTAGMVTEDGGGEVVGGTTSTVVGFSHQVGKTKRRK